MGKRKRGPDADAQTGSPQSQRNRTKTSHNGPKIAIIGAGPAGLTLALLLARCPVLIDFVVFEQRAKPSPSASLHSGSADSNEGEVLQLFPESGIAALKACFVYEEVKRKASGGSVGKKVCDMHGNWLYSDDGDMNRGEERLLVERGKLLELLVSKIYGNKIRWGWKVLSAQHSPANESQTGGAGNDEENDADPGGLAKYRSNITLTLSPPSRMVEVHESFTHIIGADGIWSKIRSLLTPTRPTYSGIQCMSMQLHSIRTRYSHLSRFLGIGSLIALGSRNGFPPDGVIARRSNSWDRARVYVMQSFPNHETAYGPSMPPGMPFERPGHHPWVSTELVKRTLIGAQFQGWAPLVKELVSAAVECHEKEGVISVDPVYYMPLNGDEDRDGKAAKDEKGKGNEKEDGEGHGGLFWEHKPGITMLGDAAHLMGPWTWDAVDMAMRDALDLARGIIDGYQAARESVGGEHDIWKSVDERIDDFEKNMCERVRVKAQESLTIRQMMFMQDGARELAEFYMGTGTAKVEPQGKHEPRIKKEEADE